MFIVAGELSFVVIVRPDGVRVEVPMDHRMRVLSVGLVQVLLGNNRRDGDVGRQDHADNDPTDTRGHGPVIMATGPISRQRHPH